MKNGIGLEWWIRTYRLAIERRLRGWFAGNNDPYPTPPGDVCLSPSLAHFADYDNAPLRLAWTRAGFSDPNEWQREARRKLTELLGYERRQLVPRAAHQEEYRLGDGLRRRRAYLRARQSLDIPIHLVWKDDKKREARPVLLYMAGSTSGVHVAWGDALIPADYLVLGAGADMARQAAERGYLVLCIEQSCFGERLERHLPRRSQARCLDAASHALLLGRTLMGERVMDVSSVIDWLVTEEGGFKVDLERLHLFGHSSGGSVAVYAAAVDLRIKAVVASGCVGFIRETIARRSNPEGEAIVPGILQWMEFDDIVSLCAPRPFIAVSGIRDHIYPFDGVKAVTDRAKEVYRLLGGENMIRAVMGHAGHRYYPDVTWKAVSEITVS